MLAKEEVLLAKAESQHRLELCALTSRELERSGALMHASGYVSMRQHASVYAYFARTRALRCSNACVLALTSLLPGLRALIWRELERSEKEVEFLKSKVALLEADRRRQGQVGVEVEEEEAEKEAAEEEEDELAKAEEAVVQLRERVTFLGLFRLY